MAVPASRGRGVTGRTAMNWLGKTSEEEKREGAREKPDIVKHAERLAENDREYGRDNPKNPNNRPNGRW
jgi:hypothetical protein